MSKFSIHKQRNEMLISYVDEISKVGGCPELFLERIDKMTVWEMFEALAQNGVRFTTERESAKKLVKTDVWQFDDDCDVEYIFDPNTLDISGVRITVGGTV